MDELNLNEASDLIIEIFDVNEFQSSSTTISFLYSGLKIIIWKNQGLHSVVLEYANSGKGYYASIVAKIGGVDLLDSAYKVEGLSHCLTKIKSMVKYLVSILKDPNVDSLYREKCGVEALEIS